MGLLAKKIFEIFVSQDKLIYKGWYQSHIKYQLSQMAPNSKWVYTAMNWTSVLFFTIAEKYSSWIRNS